MYTTMVNGPQPDNLFVGGQDCFQVISWDDLSVNCYWMCGIKKTVAPNARKFRRKVHHPKGAIHQCYNTNGWTKDVQSACWKNSQEISYTRVNQHSILRLGDSSSNVFIFLAVIFHSSGVSLTCSVWMWGWNVGKHHTNKNWHVWYMGVSLNGGTPKTPQNDHF